MFALMGRIYLRLPKFTGFNLNKKLGKIPF